MLRPTRRRIELKPAKRYGVFILNPEMTSLTFTAEFEKLTALSLDGHLQP